MLTLVPCFLKAASKVIAEQHRHHRPPQGGLFAIAAHDGDKRVGVAVIGRPVAQELQDGFTAEVTRLCTDGTPNACSFLYGAAARAARSLGYRRLYTYILIDEPGTSLRAAGWQYDGFVSGRSWNAHNRPRVDKHPTCDKQRWLKVL